MTDHDPGQGARRSETVDEDYLAFRVLQKAVRLFAFPASLVIGVGAFYGYNLRSTAASLSSEVDAINGRMQRMIDSVSVTASNQLDSLSTLLREIERLRGEQEEQIDYLGRVADQQLNHVVDQAMRLGGTLQDLSQTEETLTSLNERADSASAATAVMWARVDSAIGALRSTRDTVETAIQTVRDRVFGSWSFVVHEKRRSELVPLPLSVRMGIIRDGVLQDFEVLAGDSVLAAPRHFVLGDSRCVAAPDGKEYWLTPSYIVELFLGADIAGLEVQQVVDEPSGCTEGGLSGSTR